MGKRKQSKDTVGQQLTLAAITKGVSTSKLAKKVGISAGFCAHLLADHIAIKPDIAKKFEKALGVKFTKAELQSHNETAKAYWTKYRADLKAKNEKIARGQATLPGFSEQLPKGATVQEMVEELVGQALLRLITTGKKSKVG